MCAKLRQPPYAALLLDVLVPMMLRLPDDSGAWEEAEPDGGLARGDGGDDDESEAVNAQEGLDRLGAALDGEGVGALLLTRLGALPPAAAWKQTHVATVAVAIAAEHCPATLAPHLPAVVARLGEAARAAEARVRWAALFALAVLAEEFEELASEHAPSLLPLLVAGLADAAPRVHASAAVATAALGAQLRRDALLAHAPPLLRALHALLAAPATRDYVVGAAAAALAAVCARAGGAAVPMGLMPLLRQRLAHAAARGAAPLVGRLVEAVGALSTDGRSTRDLARRTRLGLFACRGFIVCVYVL